VNGISGCLIFTLNFGLVATMRFASGAQFWLENCGIEVKNLVGMSCGVLVAISWV
jgi:hypothetical protein